METLNTILTWYIFLSICCSATAVVFKVMVTFLFKKEERPLRYIVTERLVIILPLFLIFAFLGFAAGMLIKFVLESSGYPQVSYELYGGPGQAIGTITGVTFGWLFAFWPAMRPLPVQQKSD